MANRQDLTSPHITRTTSATSNSTMEVVTESWFNEEQSDAVKKGSLQQGGWGPPLVQRKQRAWEETPGERTVESDKGAAGTTAHVKPPRTSTRVLQQKTEQWVKDTAVPVEPSTLANKLDKAHPMSAETQHFLESMVTNMRDDINSNTGVMALLQKPVSVFDEPELANRDINMDEQDAINKELEEFLKQIKEIRDGPTDQHPVQGEIAQELSVHMSVQKEAVEKALDVLQRELTQDSIRSRPVTPHEEEYKKLVREATTMSSEQTATPRSDTSLISGTGTATSHDTSTTPQPDAPADDPTQEEGKEGKEEGQEEYYHVPKRMGLYELLDLHPDPKVRKAALKMKRLDEQLKMVIRKEKEVKKQHELLNKQLLLYTTGATLLNNAPGDQPDQGDDLTVISELQPDEAEEGEEVTPIFPTQLVDDTTSEVELPPLSPSGCSVTVSSSGTTNTRKHKHSPKSSASSQKHPAKSTTNPAGAGAGKASSRANSRAKHTGSSFSKREDKKKMNNKNFIVRNKELAQNAQATIAMTDAEKQRLEELLLDIDEIDDKSTTKQPNSDSTLGTVAVLNVNGFKASPEEESRLNEINNMLVIEEGSAMSICSKSTDLSVFSVQSKMISELDEKCPLEADKKLGEHALKTLTKNRSEQERIQMIDDMLSKFNNDEEPPEVPRSALDELLSQCRAETAKPDQEPGGDQESLLSLL